MYRPETFVQTVVIVTVSFMQNINDGNDNSFLQQFSLSFP